MGIWALCGGSRRIGAHPERRSIHPPAQLLGPLIIQQPATRVVDLGGPGPVPAERTSNAGWSKRDLTASCADHSA